MLALAFAVAAVCAFAIYVGGATDLYLGPAIIAAVAWIALMFVPQPRFG